MTKDEDHIKIMYMPEYAAWRIVRIVDMEDPETNEMGRYYSVDMMFESREKFKETFESILKLWSETYD